MKIFNYLEMLFGGAHRPAQHPNSASVDEASLRFLAELQQCCARLPEGKAEVVIADRELHLCLQWEEGEAAPATPASPKALAFWVNGANLDVDYQEVEWPMMDESLNDQEEAPETAVAQDLSVKPMPPAVQPQAEPVQSQEPAVKPNRETKISTLISQETLEDQEIASGESSESNHSKQLAVQQLLAFLQVHYAFRYNVLTARTEYAAYRDDRTLETYRPVDPRALNSISMAVIRAGIPCSDHDVKRYLESNEMALYHPFAAYMSSLPQWDGIDRVSPLAQRVSSQDLWVRGFHRWMLGMAAQWMGKTGVGQRANSVAPILVSSRQGLGKSTFCRRLLPELLQPFYTDSFDLVRSTSLQNRLTSFGLVNMDEFDRIPASRMPQLKNLMQMEDLYYRRAFRRDAEYLPRIASFIGTSNRHDLLTDLTGSRRFLCVEVEKEIDCVTPIEYDQLYAQLKQELEQGERCWFDKEEEAEIQAANQAFYCTSPAEDVVKDCVTFADADTPGARFCSASALYALLKRSHGSVLRNCPPQTFSRLLTQLGHRVHTRYGNGYWVVLQDPE